MRRRRHQRQAADAVGMVERQRQRQRPAERVADDERAFQAERLDEGGHHAGLGAERRRGAGRPRRVAAARTIQRDHLVVGGERREPRLREVQQLPRQAMDHDDRRPGAGVHVVQPAVADLDEAAAGRQRLLDALRNHPGESGQAAADQGCEAEESCYEAHACTFSKARALPLTRQRPAAFTNRSIQRADARSWDRSRW